MPVYHLQPAPVVRSGVQVSTRFDDADTIGLTSPSAAGRGRWSSVLGGGGRLECEGGGHVAGIAAARPDQQAGSPLLPPRSPACSAGSARARRRCPAPGRQRASMRSVRLSRRRAGRKPGARRLPAGPQHGANASARSHSRECIISSRAAFSGGFVPTKAAAAKNSSGIARPSGVTRILPANSTADIPNATPATTGRAWIWCRAISRSAIRPPNSGPNDRAQADRHEQGRGSSLAQREAAAQIHHCAIHHCAIHHCEGLQPGEIEVTQAGGDD